MVVVNVDISEELAKKIPNKNGVISIETLYEYDDENFNSVKVGEKASDILDFLRKGL